MAFWDELETDADEDDPYYAQLTTLRLPDPWAAATTALDREHGQVKA